MGNIYAIYQIINPTDLVYIGISTNIKQRFSYYKVYDL